jgi:hypothetical protein
MSDHKLRWLGLGLAASARAGLLALTAIINSAFAYGAPLADSPRPVAPVGINPPDGNNAVSIAELMGSQGTAMQSAEDLMAGARG